MKIVTWNCNGAFRKKFHEISSLDADLYIIQECEDPAHSSGEYKIWSENSHWHGVGKHKGLGVFAKNGARIEPLEWQDNGLQLFLPVKVNSRFNLIAVWTKEANSPTFRYIGQGRRVDKRSAIHHRGANRWMALRLSTLQLLLFEWQLIYLFLSDQIHLHWPLRVGCDSSNCQKASSCTGVIISKYVADLD